jgi:phospholipid-binding lipoprotein MlaA
MIVKKTSLLILCVVAAVFAIGCASPPKSGAPSDPNDSQVADDSDSEDPWEGFNRSMFWFNEKADIYVLRPVAVGWDWVMPDIVQTGFKNIYANFRFPIHFANNLFQAKPMEATRHLGRFLLNSTMGLGGMLDPASAIGLEARNEDFGQTLGYWGVPTGPYLVLPFLGPGSPRHTVGRVADTASQPVSYFVPFWASITIATPNVINTRARYIEEIDENRKTALDFYTFQRNAYMSYRENLVNNSQEDEATDTGGLDLYYYDEDE